MFMPVDFKVDWERIKQKKQRRIDKSNNRGNKKRIDHVYQENDLVTLERGRIIPKLSFPRRGPYCVVQAHDNGTVTIQKEPFVTEQFNIIRVSPHYANPNG